MLVNLKTLGKVCQDFRRNREISQLKVAYDTNYSIENISAFECGRNDNARILLWYFAHGLTMDELKRGGVDFGI